MTFKFSPIAGCSILYNGFADVIAPGQSRERAYPANPSLAFTYYEVMAIHDLIKANKHRINIACRVGTTTYHNGSGRRIATFETMVGNMSGDSVFYLQKDTIPGEAPFYEGSIFNTNWIDKESFETYNFDIALRKIRARLERDKMPGEIPSLPPP